MSSVPVASGSDMASLAAVWAYILPALDHIMRSQPESPEAPPLDVNYHMGVYTVVYNFATASRTEKSTGRSGFMTHGLGFGLGLPGQDDEDDSPFGSGPEDVAKDWNVDRVERIKSMVGYELYGHLEDYFRGVARQVRSRAPPDESAFLPFYLAEYTRYASGVSLINRLFAYLNRHFITRAVDEGLGWISLQDILKEKPRPGKKSNKDIELLELRKKEALKQWGFNGGSPEQRRFAEACAEAGSPFERIVPVASLAHRCWRTEVIEPFLSAGVPKASLEITNGDATPTPSTPDIANGVAHKLDSLTSIPSDPPLSKSAKKNKKKKSKAKGKQRDDTPNDNEPVVDEPSTTAEEPSTNGNPSVASTPPGSHSPVPPPLSQHPQPAPPPKGRLNRAVGDLILGTRGPIPTSTRDLALKLSRSLKASGVSPDNLIRKRLEKFLKG